VFLGVLAAGFKLDSSGFAICSRGGLLRLGPPPNPSFARRPVCPVRWPWYLRKTPSVFSKIASEEMAPAALLNVASMSKKHTHTGPMGSVLGWVAAQVVPAPNICIHDPRSTQCPDFRPPVLSVSLLSKSLFPPQAFRHRRSRSFVVWVCVWRAEVLLST